MLFPIPTGIRAWIEDVIVDDAARGKGVGRLLNETAIDHAFSQGAITVDLTSRPSREAANRLYQRIGFVARDTNALTLSNIRQRHDGDLGRAAADIDDHRRGRLDDGQVRADARRHRLFDEVDPPGPIRVRVILMKLTRRSVSV